MTEFIGEVKMTVFIVSEVKMTGFIGPGFEVKVTGLGPCFEGMDCGRRESAATDNL